MDLKQCSKCGAYSVLNTNDLKDINLDTIIGCGLKEGDFDTCYGCVGENDPI